MDDQNIIKSKFIEYAKQTILKAYSLEHSDTELMNLIIHYAKDVDYVRIQYRNPSAHTNALTKVKAEDCFNFVLDVEKLLKKMLDSFDE